MNLEAFLSAIAAEPDDDLPRLAFADWLEETGQPERAEFVRLSCRLDPDRHRFDDEAVNGLRERVERLLAPERDAEWRWWNSLDGRNPMGNGVSCQWRRGFVDSLALPVQWFLEYGGEIRRRYPLLRKLAIFRLNGWGERLAECEWLRGIREIEFPCWYADGDAAAVANSPHLGAVERLELWSGGGPGQGRLFARGKAWPKLREMCMVSAEGPAEDWVRAVNEAAGRPLAAVRDIFREDLSRFPFAARFGDGYGFFVGKLPDGTQLFAYGPESSPSADGWLFNPDGTRREPFRFEFPAELVVPFEEWGTPAYDARQGRVDEVQAARRAHLTERTGWKPAYIRVEGFTIEAWEMYGPFYDEKDYPGRHWGRVDDPEEDNFEGYGSPGGAGEAAYRRVRSAEYKFFCGDALWVCDRTGEVVFT